MLVGFLRHHGMAYPRAAHGTDGNILNKQSRTAEKRQYYSFRLGMWPKTAYLTSNPVINDGTEIRKWKNSIAIVFQ
jgi:hypothetical protein